MDGKRGAAPTRGTLLPVAAVVVTALAVLAVGADIKKPTYEAVYSVLADRPIAPNLLRRDPLRLDPLRLDPLRLDPLRLAREAVEEEAIAVVLAPTEEGERAKIEVAYCGDNPAGPSMAREAALRVAEALATPPLTEQQISDRLYAIDLQLVEARNAPPSESAMQQGAADAKQALLVERTALLLDRGRGHTPRVERARLVRNGRRGWLNQAAPVALVVLLAVSALRLAAPDRRPRVDGPVATASLLASPTRVAGDPSRAAA